MRGGVTARFFPQPDENPMRKIFFRFIHIYIMNIQSITLYDVMKRDGVYIDMCIRS